MQNINSVVVTGNLTRDPELRSTEGGTKVCNLRIAVNGRRKNANEEWVDRPNYFNVTVWGAQGESCATYLSKGRPLAVQGRLDFRERDTDDGHREYVSIVAEAVQFLGTKPQDENGAGGDTEAQGEEEKEDIPF